MPCSCAGGSGIAAPMSGGFGIGSGMGMVPIWAGDCSGNGGGTCANAICMITTVGENLPTPDNPCFYAPSTKDIQNGHAVVGCVSVSN